MSLPDTSPLFSGHFGDQGFVRERRAIKPIRALQVTGAIDVVFIRSDSPLLEVAADSAALLADIETNVVGDTLHIGMRKGSSANSIHINCAGGSVFVNGARVSGGDLNISGGRVSISTGQVAVCIALTSVETVSLVGSGDIELRGLDQQLLELSVAGSGDIKADGVVATLRASVAGSGDIDTRDLKAQDAAVSVAGSGDVSSYASRSARATVSGSGDIVIHGNPAERQKSVSGSGSVRFR